MRRPDPQGAGRNGSGRFIYIACPWTPKGGGMYKVADYLIQSQAVVTPEGHAALRPLDTRGGYNAALSLVVLIGALSKLVAGRITGRVAGVHVNMAERLSLFRKSAVVIACRALGIPVVLHLHAAQLHHFYRKLPRPLQAFTRWVFSLPDTCLVLGTVAREFVATELHVPMERIGIVINGVPGPSEPRRVPQDGAAQRILFIGNLSERKGVTDLLQALAEPVMAGIPFEASFLGDGDIARYQGAATKLGIAGKVRFEGWKDQKETARFLSRADVLVLPSYDEGLPLVILEALANGVAVVATPVGEIPKVLTDGENVSLVQPGNVQDIARGLSQVLTDTALRGTLERRGQQIHRKSFSLESFFAQIARVHQSTFGVSGGSKYPQAGAGSDDR